MKLRKALDKANQERLENQTDITGEMNTAPGSEASVMRHAAQAKMPWKAPVYSESLSVRLDPQKLIKNRCSCISPDAAEMDAFKVLRTQILQRTKEQGMNTIMVTSVQPGEGKTLTAINLALTFAREHQQTVLLIDCDLKKQDIRRYLDISNQKGLVDYLEHNLPLKDCIIWPGIEKLSLISGGHTVSDSTELLGSPKMKSLLDEMKNRYEDRYIIMDVPAVLDGADAMVLAPLVDGIIMVVEKGATPLSDIKKAVDLLPQDKFLGFVMNDRIGR